MNAVNLDDSALRFAVVLAVSSAAENPVGTEHLLATLASRGVAAAPLGAVEVTPTVARALVRANRGRWQSADSADRAPEVDVRLSSRGKPLNLTPAAAAAIQSSADPVELLLALLADESNRATELLHLAGVDLPALREAIRGGALPTVPERVDAALRPTRDALIGRTRYRARGRFDWFRAAIVRARVNYARTPVVWASLEADELARRRGHRHARSDDLLLAILSTHEVAERYPYLKQEAADQYQGGGALACAGVRYEAALQAADATDLGTDPQPLKVYVPSGEHFPSDTGLLLDALVTAGSNRATRLLTALGVEHLHYEER
jgi:hypothetical protein